MTLRKSLHRQLKLLALDAGGMKLQDFVDDFIERNIKAELKRKPWLKELWEA